MKRLLNGLWMVLLIVLLCRGAQAYPPAPEVLIYGMVKNQYGQPIVNPSDKVFLQTPNGVQIVTSIQPNLAVGINYAIWVPMDSGISPALYTTNALTNGSLYTLYVYDSGATNLPMEMIAGPVPIAPPSQTILQNLTLGNDSNHDGIPDVWETSFLDSIGLNISLTNINAGSVYTSDGRTLYQEYLLGNYPYNPGAFSVSILGQTAGSAVLAFTTTAGRSYNVFGSTDFKTWTQLNFTVPSVSTALVNSYFSSVIQPLQIRTAQPTNYPPMQFFRILLR